MSGHPPFPAECPVEPLGFLLEHHAGASLFVYRSAHGREFALAPERHGGLGLVALFAGNTEWLEEHFPAPHSFLGFNQRAAALALIRECCRKGPVK